MAKLDLPVAVRHVLEPVFQSMPLTELETFLSNAYFLHYVKQYLPTRLARLRQYHSLPSHEAAVLALTHSEYDILDRILYTDMRTNQDVLRYAFESHHDTLLQYYTDRMLTDSRLTNRVLSACIADKCDTSHELSKWLISQTQHVNDALVLAAEVGNLTIAQYAVAQGAVAIVVALAAQQDMDHDMAGVRLYLHTIPSMISIEQELLALARERYPSIGERELRYAIYRAKAKWISTKDILKAMTLEIAKIKL